MLALEAGLGCPALLPVVQLVQLGPFQSYSLTFIASWKMDVGWMLVRIDFNDFNDFNPFQPIDMATVDSRSLLPLPPGPACEVQ